jgi:hypothetical protein
MTFLLIRHRFDDPGSGAPNLRPGAYRILATDPLLSELTFDFLAVM